MDKIVKTAVGLFVIILVVFVGVVSYTTYIEMKYKNSLTGTYSYTCNITTDSVLSNVTFFIPVPADLHGNSPVIAKISDRTITGIPDDWTYTLFDTGKATLLKITAPSIGKAPVNGSVTTTTITLVVNTSSPALIDTRTPIENSAMFRPVQEIHMVECPAGDVTNQDSPECFAYLTSTYADYTADPSVSVSISANLEATNSWTIFSPGSNSYKNRISVLMHGDNHGWVTTKGWLESGIGVYDAPKISS